MWVLIGSFFLTVNLLLMISNALAGEADLVVLNFTVITVSLVLLLEAMKNERRK